MRPHIVPSIQTSLQLVNRRKLIDSGAIHFIGSFPLVAENNRKHDCDDHSNEGAAAAATL